MKKNIFSRLYIYTMIGITSVPTFLLAQNPSSSPLKVIKLGSSANALGSSNSGVNQVSADQATGTVVFIHGNIEIKAGKKNNQLVYDYSIDKGENFPATQLNQGPIYNKNLNGTGLTHSSPLYPSAILYNPIGNTDSKNIILTGISSAQGGVTDSNPKLRTIATYSGSIGSPNNFKEQESNFNSKKAWIPLSQCQGRTGEFWSLDRRGKGDGISFDTLGIIDIYKGTLTNGIDINWVLFDSIIAPFNKSFSPNNAVLSSPRIAFSPNGQIGWISILGDFINDGTDTVATFSPIFYKSIDGGTTWSAPIIINLTTFPKIMDNLDTISTDDDGNILGVAIPFIGRETGMGVDINGNPHLLSVIFSLGRDKTGRPKKYDFAVNANKFIYDLTLDENKWKTGIYAPINFFKGIVCEGETLIQENNPHVSMSPDGTKATFTWIDTDSLLYDSSEPNGAYNSAPNLFAKSYDVIHKDATSTENITAGSYLDANVKFPAVAPIGLYNDSKYITPVVCTQVDPQNCGNTTNYLYFNIIFEEHEYHPIIDTFPPDTTNITETSNQSFSISSNYPNPFYTSTTIDVNLKNPALLNLEVTNMLGQVITSRNNNYPSGKSQLIIDASGYAPGVYFYTITIVNDRITNKMIVK